MLDYRLSALKTAPNVELYLDSRIGAEEALAFGCDRVVVATGSRWTKALYSSLELPVGALVWLHELRFESPRRRAAHTHNAAEMAVMSTYQGSVAKPGFSVSIRRIWATVIKPKMAPVVRM